MAEPPVDFGRPEEVLLGFLAAMRAWDRAAWERKRQEGDSVPPDERQGRLDRERRAVLDQFCTPKERKYAVAHLSDPPQYDPATEEVARREDHGPGEVFLYTVAAAWMNQRRRYALVNKGGRWLIDTIAWQTAGGTWARGIL